jgi:transcriptional regulator with XRE-family HTH domain
MISETKSQATAPKILGMKEKTLKQLIHDSSLTYRELAQRVGTSHSMIVRWCKPDAELTVTNYLKLAKVLNVSLKKLAISIGQDVTDIPDDIYIDSDPWSN